MSPIPQTSNWSGTFFAVSYSKPSLVTVPFDNFCLDNVHKRPSQLMMCLICKKPDLCLLKTHVINTSLDCRYNLVKFLELSNNKWTLVTVPLDDFCFDNVHKRHSQ